MSQFCIQCGKEIPPESRFCSFCGTTVESRPNRDGATVSVQEGGVSRAEANIPGKSNLLLYIFLPVGAVILAAGIILLVVLAGSKGGPGTTPEQTFKNMQAIMRNNDWESLHDFVPPSEKIRNNEMLKSQLQDIINQKTVILQSRPQLEDAFKKLEGKIQSYGGDISKIQSRAVFAMFIEWNISTNEMFKNEFLSNKDATIEKAEINVDRAEIKLSGKEYPVTMIRENGLWYPR